MPTIRTHNALILDPGYYKAGDQPPSSDGYLEWHEWAEVQHKAGLRQRECAMCGKWKYPQELSTEIRSYTAQTRQGNNVRMIGLVCNGCVSLQSNT